MKPLFNLDNRLSLCASFVREGKNVADIGTDHAYLPVWLCLSGKTPLAVAADINTEPLIRGDITVKKYNADRFVSTVLSDGLKEIDPNFAQDIIIAGMGAELIVKILNDAPWIKNQDIHLILQPMSKSECLIEYLYDSGFNIDKQQACSVGNKVYTVISAYYCAKQIKHSEAECYIGKLNPTENELDLMFLENQIKNLNNKAKSDSRYFDIIKEIQAEVFNDNN